MSLQGTACVRDFHGKDEQSEKVSFAIGYAANNALLVVQVCCTSEMGMGAHCTCFQPWLEFLLAAVAVGFLTISITS